MSENLSSLDSEVLETLHHEDTDAEKHSALLQIGKIILRQAREGGDVVELVHRWAKSLGGAPIELVVHSVILGGLVGALENLGGFNKMPLEIFRRPLSFIPETLMGWFLGEEVSVWSEEDTTQLNEEMAAGLLAARFQLGFDLDEASAMQLPIMRWPQDIILEVCTRQFHGSEYTREELKLFLGRILDPCDLLRLVATVHHPEKVEALQTILRFFRMPTAPAIH